jgi:hypothetical protein
MIVTVAQDRKTSGALPHSRWGQPRTVAPAPQQQDQQAGVTICQQALKRLFRAAGPIRHRANELADIIDRAASQVLRELARRYLGAGGAAGSIRESAPVSPGHRSNHRPGHCLLKPSSVERIGAAI